MRKALPVVPFAHVPFPILQLYQSLSSILEFFTISRSGRGC